METLQELKDTLYDLTGYEGYDKEARRKLESYFGRGIYVARPDFIGFKGEQYTCKRYFSREEEAFMLKVGEEQISKLKDLAKRLDACGTDEEIMAICADIMMDYAQSWKDVDTRSVEAEREKRKMLSIERIDVRRGRLVHEGSGPSYNCIVLNPYYGSVVVRRQADGQYSVTQRVPLCGESSGTYDAIHLKKCMIDFMRFIGN